MQEWVSDSLDPKPIQGVRIQDKERERGESDSQRKETGIQRSLGEGKERDKSRLSAEINWIAFKRVVCS
jgi:hypothetical protein